VPAEAKLLIPSFSSTTALFAQHFSILRELKKNIEDLRVKYEGNERGDQLKVIEKILN